MIKSGGGFCEGKFTPHIQKYDHSAILLVGDIRGLDALREILEDIRKISGDLT